MMSVGVRDQEGLMRRAFGLLVVMILSVRAGETSWAAPVPAAAPAAKTSRLEWFNQAKFGLFIHWGPYAVPGGEWDGKTSYGEWLMLQANIPSKKYEEIARQLNPVKFDAREWVGLAKDAGMNYLVITAKHHDGFCMYDSKLTDYDIVDFTPFKRDPLKELAEESRKAGIKFCAYYSIVDWHHPDFPAKYSQLRRDVPGGFHGDPQPNADIKKYAQYMKGQVRELLTQYGDVGILWFDGGGSFRNRDRRVLLDGAGLVDMIHEQQPGCLVNNRLGFGADYGTPEQTIPDAATGKAFEVCMTLNKHWGYNKADQDWKSARTVIHNLVDIASKGGNYLLNVGPTAEGIIPPEAVRILREAGQWVKANGEAIYGTTAGPSLENIRVGNDARMTRRPGKLYLTLLEWPRDRTVFMEGMKGHLVGKIYALGDPERKPLQYEAGERTVKIQLPAAAPDPNATVLVIELASDEPLEDWAGSQASAG
jgi:alpha-L-fucosidase